MKPRRVLENYINAVGCLSSKDKNGDEGAGTAFHVGDGIFVTARHCVEGRSDFKLSQPQWPGADYANITGEFMFHPEETVDVALFQTDGHGLPYIPLGAHLDDWFTLEFLLCEVVVFGFPAIPLSRYGSIVVSRGEVNATVDLMHSQHPHFLLSTVARGGFSGAPVYNEDHGLLGMITESLLLEGQATESGFQAAISVEPILVTMGHTKLIPSVVRSFWEEHGVWSFDPEEVTGLFEESTQNATELFGDPNEWARQS